MNRIVFIAVLLVTVASFGASQTTEKDEDMNEMPEDKIVKISDPFLQYDVVD